MYDNVKHITYYRKIGLGKIEKNAGNPHAAEVLLTQAKTVRDF
jgi:hypothetical protein